MSKVLVLLRHAKSAWPPGVADHDRPLSKRGRRDASAVGQWLRHQGALPDVALVSSASRTTETFELVAGALRPPPRQIVTEEIYRAGTGDLLDLVRGLADDVSTALIVGHNPSIATLAALLDAEAGELPFKTSSVAVFDVGSRWADTTPGAARLVTSATPRG